MKTLAEDYGDVSVIDLGTASVNRDLACLSKILSMAFDNELKSVRTFAS